MREVDVAITGGGFAAVAAARAAAGQGARTLLLAPRLGLGEDLCDTLRLWPECLPSDGGPLREACARAPAGLTPLVIKHFLTRSLLDAGVEVLLGCLPTGLLEDADGELSGLVIANRAGRQALAAKAILDGGTRPLPARWEAGASFASSPRRPVRLRRVVIGGQETAGDHLLKTLPGAAREGDKAHDAHLYEIEANCDPFDPISMARADQDLRDCSRREGVRAAGSLWIADESDRDVPFSETLPWVRDEATGARMGHRAAERARERPAPRGLRVRGVPGVTATSGVDLRERLTGLRPTDGPHSTVAEAARDWPVSARAEVLVVGGGTAGAAAAIAAAEDGRDVLLLEFQNELGGVGTVGRIGSAYHGLDIGFAAQVPFAGPGCTLSDKAEMLRRRLRQAGGRVVFSALTHGVLMHGREVRGVVLATPWGGGVVTATTVIDATGNVDVAAATGAPTIFGDDADDIALQGTGLSLAPLEVGKGNNSDYLLVDECDVVDVSSAVLGATLAAGEAKAFDIVGFVQSRERRRLGGTGPLTYLDQLLERRYPDTIAISRSDYDSHGYPSHPFFALLPHTSETITANHPAPSAEIAFTPYRCLLPDGIEGLLVAGIGIRMQRDAYAMVRMQRDLLNQGYAVGLAASMAVAAHCPPRRIDVPRLQQRLQSLDILPEPERYLPRFAPNRSQAPDTYIDTYLDPDRSYRDRCLALAWLYREGREAREPLARRYQRTDRPEEALALAKFLGLLGDPVGVPRLIEALEPAEFDPRILQGAMAEYAHLPTPVDALILALGHAGDRCALPVLLRKLTQLTPETPLSHHRAVAQALECLRDPSAASPLADKLREPGMSGHAMHRIEPLYNHPMSRRRREGALREIVLARALWRCGDCEGLAADILERYRRDLRGLFARHAAALLSE